MSLYHPWLSSAVIILILILILVFRLLVYRLGNVQARGSMRHGSNRLDVVLQADGTLPSEDPTHTERQQELATIHLALICKRGKAIHSRPGHRLPRLHHENHQQERQDHADDQYIGMVSRTTWSWLVATTECRRVSRVLLDA